MTRRRRLSYCGNARLSCAAALLCFGLSAQTQVADPGVRGGPAGVGAPLPNLGNKESSSFNQGLDAFQEIASVTGSIGGTEAGLGPRFNLNSCAGCHFHPAIGGSSPAVNPQRAVANLNGASNVIPDFIRIDGPVMEARFKFADSPVNHVRDGGVHALFTITGRTDAAGCNIAQPDFITAAAQRNLSFRVPTPTFGGGFIEGIKDITILDNKGANAAAKSTFGISGHENREGNTGTITRFGWKAQNKSLAIFSGEAYNVEQGVTNEFFPHERDETAGCLFNPTPEDHVSFAPGPVQDLVADVIAFSNFMRFLAPPTPVASFGNVPASSISSGKALFESVASGGIGWSR